MSFARFQVTKSTNIIYEGPQAKLSTVNIENPTNYLKLLYNNDGVLDYLDYSPLNDIVVYPTFADFPVTGDTDKLYYEQEFKSFTDLSMVHITSSNMTFIVKLNRMGNID
jgi:hypothetical protein